MQEKFYQKKWFIWVMLVFFAPAGVFLLWEQKRYKQAPRIVMTLLFSWWFALIIIPSVIISGIDVETDTSNEAIAEETNAENNTELDVEENKIENESIKEADNTDVSIDNNATQEETKDTTQEETTTKENESNEVTENQSSNTTETIQVHFIDVGQGDSIFIDAGEYDILIDAGDNKYGQTVVNYLNSLNVDDIDLLISTHPHADHVGGLDTVLNNFDVEQIIWSGETSDTITFNDYWTAVTSESSKYIEDSNMTFEIFDGLEFKVIETGDSWSNTNDYSVVTLLDYNNIEILFTGDMEQKAEISALGLFSDIDVLKVGHHGSKTSTSEQFLNVIDPEYAVISSGVNNRYDHPHNETLQILNNHGVDIYRTDEMGNVILTTDGNSITFNTEPSVFIKNTTTAEVEEQPEQTSDNNEVVVVVETSNPVIISALNKSAEFITITNTGSSDINLSNWKILSVTGGQTFYFPDYVLKAGSSVKVGGYDAKSTSDFVWEKGRGIWNNGKSDPAELYSSDGVLVDRYDD